MTAFKLLSLSEFHFFSQAWLAVKSFCEAGKKRKSSEVKFHLGQIFLGVGDKSKDYLCNNVLAFFCTL